MEKLKFLVIGTNFISDKFCLAVNKLPFAEVCALYSRKLDTGEAFGLKYGIKNVYTDLDVALEDSDVNAVYVASPTFLHKEHSIRAMERGKHVLCEKAISLSCSELLEMMDVSSKCGVVLLEAMRPAFDPAIKILRDAVAEIGKIRRASLTFCQYSSRYDKFKAGIVENAFDPSIGNSALSDIGVYPLWIAVMLFGAPFSITSKKIYLHNGFLAMGESVLDYNDKLVTVGYSKINDSHIPSVIEGELGYVTIDKISEPSEIKITLRNTPARTLDYTKTDNNMIYEITEFFNIINGSGGQEKYNSISASVMKIMDEILVSE